MARTDDVPVFGADLVFDVRYMENPFYIEDLRPLRIRRAVTGEVDVDDVLVGRRLQEREERRREAERHVEELTHRTGLPAVRRRRLGATVTRSTRRAGRS